MKNTILKTIILFLLTIPFQSDAQKYRKMLGDSSVWYEVHVFEGAYTNIIEVYGDTLIQNISYKTVPVKNSSWQFHAFLREDTLARKIFLKRSDSINIPETVLYDFNKNVGDTVNTDFFYDGLYIRSDKLDTSYLIDSIKMLPMLGDSIRNFYGHKLGYHKNRFHWIEGVGSPQGLFTSYNTLNKFNFISCKFTDNLHVYKIPKGVSFYNFDSSCYLYVSSISSIENAYSIYPNPFTNKLTIEGKPLQNCKAEVYDITGKLLETIIINGNEINFNNYYNGLVLIRIFDRQGHIVGVVKGVKL